MAAYTTKGQCTIVKTRAMAETCAAAIESHAGAENRVEESRADPLTPLGFMHAEVVPPRVRAQGHETHGAGAEIRDPRQVDLAAAMPRELDQGPGAQLLGHGGIQADAFAGGQPAGVPDVRGDRLRGVLTLRGIHGAAQRQELFAK
jgi:hypothetical protein